MNERLQKLIAAAGLCSRRTAEEWIVQGKVTVNGGLARLGDTADPEADRILVDGRPLPAAPRKTTTVLLYKPRGVVTTLQDEQGRPTVAELLPPELGRLYPVGRLDQFSEGLLLMTNDGDLANRLTHPKGEVNKTYRLWVSGWHDGALEQLRRPITLDGYRIKPPTVRLLWEESGIRDQGSGIRDQGSGIRGCRDGTLPSAAAEPVGAVIGRPQNAEAPQAFPLRGWCPSSQTGADEVVSRQAIATDEALRATDSTSSVSGLAGDARCHLPLKGKAKDGEGIPSLPPGGKVPPQGANEGVPRQGTATDEALRAADSTSSVSGLAGDVRCHLPLKGKADEAAHTAALEITIHEGRNRQIRRMAEAAGLKPTRLKRIAEGGLRLGDLKPGQWRVLTAAECEALRREGENL